jgi:peroxidase
VMEVELSGAHTIGRTSCAQITHRLYEFPGSGNGIDPALDFDYALHLQDLCPQGGDPSSAVPLDPVSPNTFDNMYYTNGVTGRVLFPSDNALFFDRQTQFASNLNSQNGDFWQVRHQIPASVLDQYHVGIRGCPSC